MAKDPTVRSGTSGPEYPEGTHPPHPISEQTWSADRLTYSDAPDDEKPDPTSVVSQVEPDPIQEANDAAIRKDAESGRKQAAKDSKS